MMLLAGYAVVDDPQIPIIGEGDVEPNDTGLPAATCTDRAKYAELWCKHGSWKICEGCGSMHPQKMTPMDLKRVADVPRVTLCVVRVVRRGSPRPISSHGQSD